MNMKKAKTMISELEVGQQYSLTLAVLSASVKETKTKQAFLNLELYDGKDRITGNLWNWNGEYFPEKNSVVTLTAVITEWQGTKQLNIKDILKDESTPITDFMPQPPNDINEAFAEAYSVAQDISDMTLRNLCTVILEDMSAQWRITPGATSIHHAYAAGTLIHSLSVAKIAKNIALQIPEANVDLASAGGLLHDVGKLLAYKLDVISCEMTDEGKMFDHLILGANLIIDYVMYLGLRNDDTEREKVNLLRHIILSHHGKLEYGSPVTPMCLEAYIVHYADMIDATTEMIRTAAEKKITEKWTDKIWALDNKPHINPKYTKVIIGK